MLEAEVKGSAHFLAYLLSYALGEQSTPERDLKKVDGERHKWQSDLNTVKAIVESARVTGRPQKQP
jgi:hypothetical protein